MLRACSRGSALFSTRHSTCLRTAELSFKLQTELGVLIAQKHVRFVCIKQGIPLCLYNCTCPASTLLKQVHRTVPMLCSMLAYAYDAQLHAWMQRLQHKRGSLCKQIMFIQCQDCLIIASFLSPIDTEMPNLYCMYLSLWLLWQVPM